MKKIYSILLVMLALSLLIYPYKSCVYAEQLSSAKSMIVMDAESSRILYSKNHQEKLPMASTTKIVTALTVLNNCSDINKEIEIDARAVGISGTSIYLKKGESLTIKELLYGLMLPSGNDSAMALAYYVGNDIPTFCKMMQETAIKCGAENSSFKNPHGLDENGHYTTVEDLAKITARALENEIFKEIVTTKSTRIKGASQGSYRYLKNKNKLLNTLDGAIGVKTGFTNKAGRCLVSACERNNFKIICVVLNCGPMFEESADLINMAYNNYNNLELLSSYKIIRRILVENGKQENVKVFTKQSFTYPLTDDEVKGISFKYNLPSVLQAPVKKDKSVGNLEIYLNNHLLFSEKIYTMDNIDKIGVMSNIFDIISNW